MSKYNAPFNFNISPYGSHYGYEDMAKCLRGKINSFIEGVPIVLEFAKKVRNSIVGVAEDNIYGEPYKPFVEVPIYELETYVSQLDASKKYRYVICETEYEKGKLHYVTWFEGKYRPYL
jgi:hypothetical protein